jgi:hypothetical protein
MRKQRVNLCFNEQDNPDVIRMLDATGSGRPSGLIHDLIRKGLILEKLLSGQVLNALGPLAIVQSEGKGQTLPSEKVAPEFVAVPPAKPEPVVEMAKEAVVTAPADPAPEPELPPAPAVAQSFDNEDGGAVVVSMSGLSGLGADY